MMIGYLKFLVLRTQRKIGERSRAKPNESVRHHQVIILYFRVLEKEHREKGAENLFEEIMVKLPKFDEILESINLKGSLISK